ncbi:hypothetical protein DFR50_12623 [Roseiarcus fermentans]|uniref:Uncharacterized protein n=1 Tax=Roseiarcus fermentans TaxID=1473586 RepID=A0A366F0J0_9HYPH|nr:hypothetical protein DFR50_12623 [Roseiarcus fermentans]
MTQPCLSTAFSAASAGYAARLAHPGGGTPPLPGRALSAPRTQPARELRWEGTAEPWRAPWEGARLAHPGGETPPLPLSAVTAAGTPGLGVAMGSSSQPRHCEEQSDEATHAAACLLRKKSLRLLLATKGGWTTRGRDSGPAALDRFASLAMTALLATGLGVTMGTLSARNVLKSHKTRDAGSALIGRRPGSTPSRACRKDDEAGGIADMTTRGVAVARKFFCKALKRLETGPEMTGPGSDPRALPEDHVPPQRRPERTAAFAAACVMGPATKRPAEWRRLRSPMTSLPERVSEGTLARKIRCKALKRLETGSARAALPDPARPPAGCDGAYSTTTGVPTWTRL